MTRVFSLKKGCRSWVKRTCAGLVRRGLVLCMYSVHCTTLSRLGPAANNVLYVKNEGRFSWIQLETLGERVDPYCSRIVPSRLGLFGDGAEGTVWQSVDSLSHSRSVRLIWQGCSTVSMRHLWISRAFERGPVSTLRRLCGGLNAIRRNGGSKDSASCL